jgi:hypothetical protein
MPRKRALVIVKSSLRFRMYRIERFGSNPMYRASVVVIEHSLRTHKCPQLRFACAFCARTEPGVLWRPFLCIFLLTAFPKVL